MKRSIPWQLEVGAVALVAGTVFFATRVGAVDPKPTSLFTTGTIDVGCFVSDPDKSVKFYTEALGFKEVPSFSVDKEICVAAGLTDGEPLENIRVLILGEGPGATKLKLSSIPKHKAKDQTGNPVSAQYGFRYLTLHVADHDASLARLEQAGVKPLRKAPVALPKSLGEGVYLTIVEDPDGNLVELVGPKL